METMLLEGTHTGAGGGARVTEGHRDSGAWGKGRLEGLGTRDKGGALCPASRHHPWGETQDLRAQLDLQSLRDMLQTR